MFRIPILIVLCGDGSDRKKMTFRLSLRHSDHRPQWLRHQILHVRDMLVVSDVEGEAMRIACMDGRGVHNVECFPLGTQCVEALGAR